ncbi:MAG: hypothetical protein RRX93_05595 [Bacteroidales bacterium]
MKNKLHVYIFLFLLFLLGFVASNSVIAQRPERIFHGNSGNKFGSNSLSLPIYPLIYNGFGIEYDRKITKQHWLKFSPTYYTSFNYATMRKTDIRSLQGFSVGLHHKYNYYTIERVGFQLFLQWGVNYSQFNIQDYNKVECSMNKFGLDIMLGFRQIIARPLYFDFFIGYGNRWILSSKHDLSAADASVSALTTNTFAKNMFDYGYGGSLLLIGINIGFLF